MSQVPLVSRFVSLPESPPSSGTFSAGKVVGLLVCAGLFFALAYVYLKPQCISSLTLPRVAWDGGGQRRCCLVLNTSSDRLRNAYGSVCSAFKKIRHRRSPTGELSNVEKGSTTGSDLSAPKTVSDKESHTMDANPPRPPRIPPAMHNHPQTRSFCPCLEWTSSPSNAKSEF